jgi:DNA-binding transcriptional MerR regulator
MPVNSTNGLKQGWHIPEQIYTGRRYSEVDLARAHLIRDLHELGVNGEGIPVILDLIDQIHGLRHVLAMLFRRSKRSKRSIGGHDPDSSPDRTHEGDDDLQYL